jgi:hypothetical protein
LVRGLCFLGAFTLVACTQDFNVFEGDGSTSGDATSEAASDSGPADSGGGDGGLVFQCNTGTVSDCSQCSGAPQPCVYCSGPSLAGRCVAQGTSCFNGAPSGYTFCGCASASSCPESYQVCRNGSCRTCSDSLNNTSLQCKGGGTCHPADGGCF